MSDNDNFAIPAPRKLAKSASDEPTSPERSPPPEQQQEQPAPAPPAQQQAPPLSYAKPDWGAVAQFDYGFEVLKNGLSIEKIQGPRKDFITIGRLPLCDIQMEHPSVSRYHCILQFNTDGNAFIYDLDSAHGTRLNKKRIQPCVYLPLQNGDQLRFGESTRICIFETEKEEEELEVEQVVRRRQKQQGLSYIRTGKVEDEEDEGATWGFQEDAEEEPDEDEDEDEEEKGKGKGKGKRTADAALIDIAQEKMMAEDAKRRRQELEIMYGDDSDEESFYDKTAPKKKKTKTVQKAETHDDLVARKALTEKQIAALEKEIERRKEEDAALKETKKKKEDAGEEDEDLDSYMSSLNKKPENKVSVLKLQGDLKKLKKDHERLEKLVKLTKPSDIFG